MCPAHSGLSQPWTCPKRHLLPFCSSPPRFLRPSVPNKIIISMQSPSLWLGGVCFLFCLFQLNLLCYQDDACPCIQHSERRASQVPGPTWRPRQLPTCLQSNKTARDRSSLKLFLFPTEKHTSIWRGCSAATVQQYKRTHFHSRQRVSFRLHRMAVPSLPAVTVKMEVFMIYLRVKQALKKLLSFLWLLENTNRSKAS